MKHLVLFSRGRDDSDPADAIPNEHTFAQLQRELDDPSLNLTELTHITHDGDSFVYLATVTHDGDQGSLVRRLQAAYDANGVAGWFEVAAND